MKLKDRLTGEIKSKFPKDIESGRYSILVEKTVLNKHTALFKGDVLFSDGTMTCKLDDNKYSFSKEQFDNDLAFDAIITIYELMGHQLDSDVSPMLPSSLVGKEIDLSSLERYLEQTIKQGHLHHIAFKPRIDLKYDEAIIDVSRAKRLSNGTLKHLASHSECWQRRTLTGVIPRKVLARFSEDDYGLYENHLYISLLDQLEKHLYGRLRRLIQLDEELSQALEFQTNTGINYKLLQEICSLWGKTFDTEQIDKQLEASKSLREFLKTSLLTIKGLKQRGVYSEITHKKHITYLHRTNILKHDPHYQHLPPLWDNIQKEVTRLKPNEVFAKNKNRFEAYCQYIGLVIHYALKKYNYDESISSFQWAGKTINLESKDGRWLLQTQKDEALEFVAWTSENVPDFQVSKNKIVCWIGSSQDRKQFEEYLSISPLDLYVVERMGILIDKWLIGLLINQYSIEIPKIPSEVLKVLEEVGFERIGKGSSAVKIFTPLKNPENILKEIDPLLNSKDQMASIRDQIYLVKELALCPDCRKESSLFESDTKGFKARCNSCNVEWSYDGSKYEQNLKKEDDKEDSFNVLGRLSFCIER